MPYYGADAPTHYKTLVAAVATRDRSTCWEPIGYPGRLGHSFIKVRGKTHGAYRVALELATGEAPEGMIACHLCPNPGCYNPDHLYWGTNATNARDREEFGNPTRGERSNLATLTEVKVRMIREQFAAGRHYQDLVAEFGVSQTQIHRIVKRTSWAHIT